MWETDLRIGDNEFTQLVELHDIVDTVDFPHDGSGQVVDVAVFRVRLSKDTLQLLVMTEKLILLIFGQVLLEKLVDLREHVQMAPNLIIFTNGSVGTGG
ncbi:hypothetical protein D3C87_1400030 [compost metagenome]